VPAVLGVDDWAIHKGLPYGTILGDLERHHPVDVLPDRSSATLATWLTAHPGVTLITRDRGGAYAAGTRDGAPDAIQVADCWHLVDTLADTLEAVFRSKGAGLKAAAAALVARAQEHAAQRDGAAAPVPRDAVYPGKRRHPQPERWRERAAAAAEAGGGPAPGDVRAGAGAARAGRCTRRAPPSPRSPARSGSRG
jgi:transposase